MKQEKTPFRFYENNVTLFYKKQEYDAFESVQKINFIHQRFSVADKLNAIGVSAELFSKLHKEKMLLVNPNNGKHVNVSLKICEGIGENDFVTTLHVQEILQLVPDTTVFLCKYKSLEFQRIRVQKIEHIRESDLVISKTDFHNVCCNQEKTPCKYLEIYNTFSQESIVVKKSHVYVDETLEPGTIRLSRKQRICLGMELPQFLSERHWAVLKENLDENSADFQLVCRLYSASNSILDEDAPYEKKMQVKKIISRYCTGAIRIIPVPESMYEKRGKLLRRICDFYVGKSTISLICRRPYDIDEGLDIVRMSKSNMSLLGIDEMDKVTLQYKNKRVSCRVLELEDEKAFLQTNLPISPDLVLGVPAHIRNKLGVMDLSSSIKIDRDTAFIFKKNINEQVVPVLLTLFSTNLFTDFSIISSALLSLVAIPVVLYFNLSSKRNMRA